MQREPLPLTSPTIHLQTTLVTLIKLTVAAECNKSSSYTTDCSVLLMCSPSHAPIIDSRLSIVINPPPSVPPLPPNSLLLCIHFFFRFPKGLLFRPPPKECFYRNSLAAREACSALQWFDSFFGCVLRASGRSTLPVCSSREETHFISSPPHPSQPRHSALLPQHERPQRPSRCFYLCF